MILSHRAARRCARGDTGLQKRVHKNGILWHHVFTWNDKKREENWQARKVDFAEAVGIFDDPEIIESADDRVA